MSTETAIEKIEVLVPGQKEKFASWIKERGGVLHWKSQDLGNLGANMFGPLRDPEGKDNRDQPPHWRYAGTRPEPITDLGAFRFALEMKEVQRFQVSIRCGQMLNFECTDASSAKIRKACDKWTEQYKNSKYRTSATYSFDYGSQEAVIEIPIFDDTHEEEFSA